MYEGSGVMIIGSESRIGITSYDLSSLPINARLLKTWRNVLQCRNKRTIELREGYFEKKTNTRSIHLMSMPPRYKAWLTRDGASIIKKKVTKGKYHITPSKDNYIKAGFTNTESCRDPWLPLLEEIRYIVIDTIQTFYEICYANLQIYAFHLLFIVYSGWDFKRRPISGLCKSR